MSLFNYRIGSGPDLVVLHGWGMNAAVWEPLLPALSAHFRVTVIELPGHGGSTAAAVADAGEWARLALDDAPPRAWWLGWSLGGQIALQAALDRPGRVEGLVLVAATPRFVQADDWPCAMPVARFRQFADSLSADPNAALMRFLSLQASGAEHARETLKLLRFELGQRPPATARGLAQGLEILLETDQRDRLAGLDMPSHWVFGARDTLVPPCLRESLAGLLAGASMDVVEGAGHAPFLSHPRQSIEVLLRRVGQA